MSLEGVLGISDKRSYLSKCRVLKVLSNQREEKEMKKFLVVLLCLMLVMGVTACGGSEPAGEGEETYLIRIASDETIDTPCSEATLIFKQLMEDGSDGRVKVEYFNDSAMGDEREIAESVHLGNLEMGIISSAYLSTYAPDWYITELPYVFMDRQEMYGFLDGEVGDFLKERLVENSNIRALDFADGSFKALLNNKKAITSVNDLAGLKIRCQENQMNMSLYKSWNGTAIPMGFSEIYTALQQGAIDGVDTSPLYMRSGKFYEVAKEYTLTNHQALLMVSIINTDFMNSLPEDLQQLVLEASHEAYTVQERMIVEEAEQYATDVMDEAGCVEYVLSDAERDTFVQASRVVLEEYRSRINPALYEMIGL
jgi:tripartite ATP-independent transporter DctP family solute receptor